jgi:hypothetical protein
MRKIFTLAWLALATGAATGAAMAGPAAPLPDGAHDFDFNLGTWHTSIRRTAHPLSGDPTMVDMSGTVTVRPIWGGRAQIEELEVDGPHGHWQGITLFLYNPKSRQWTQTYMGASDPTPSTTTGSFARGRGELYSQDTLNGRAVLVRGTWSDITPDAHRYEEAYSADGGRTWETAFSARLTRVAP